MRPLTTCSNLLDASCDLLGSPRSERGHALGLPFAVGAVTLAVLSASLAPNAAWAQKAPGKASASGAAASGVSPIAGAAPALAVDVANGPIVTIMAPHYNATLKGTAQILVGVQQRKNAPSTIDLLVDGRSQTKGAIPLVTYPSANFEWDTSKLSDGMHRLSVVITDTQGFRGGADVNVFINNSKVADLTPPSLEWLNVRQNDTWRGMVDLQLKALDNFGVRYLIISLNPASTPNKKPATQAWFLNRPPYSTNFDSRKVPDGLYSLRATAFDDLENEGLSPAITIAINNHTINPTWKLPDLPATTPVPSNRVLPQRDPNLANSDAASEAAEAAPSESPDSSSPMQLDASAATQALAAPAPSNDTPRVAEAPRSVGKPSLSQAGQTSDASASVPAASSTWGAHSLPDTRVAALPAAPRALKKALGSASLSRTEMAGRDGSASTPLALGPSASSEAAASLAQRATILSARPRVLKAGAAGASSPSKTSVAPRVAVAKASPSRTRVASAPVVAPRAVGAPALSSASSEGLLVLGPSAAASAGGADRKLSPLAPSTLPQAARRSAPARLSSAPASAPSQPLLSTSGGQERSGVVPQGSVVAPSFPNVDLTRRASVNDPRSSTPPAVAMPPVVAMAPPMGVLKRAGEASITVAALPGMMPLLHRVLAGETLASVAGRYKLPASVLAMHNKMSEEAALKPGQSLALPQTLSVSMAGETVQGDVASMMVGSVGVTPFRFLFENQGGELKWDAANQRVTATNSTHQVTLTIGSKSALVNQKEVMMDLAAFLVSGRTMVPLRFFEKALSASVEWEPATGRLLVAMAQ